METYNLNKCIVIRSIPKNISPIGLRNILENIGIVISFRIKGDHVYAEFSTAKEAVLAIRSLNHSSYGFQACLNESKWDPIEKISFSPGNDELPKFDDLAFFSQITWDGNEKNSDKTLQPQSKVFQGKSLGRPRQPHRISVEDWKPVNVSYDTYFRDYECLNCSDWTAYKCKICSIPFCSTTCQRIKAQEHITYCNNMEKSDVKKICFAENGVHPEASLWSPPNFPDKPRFNKRSNSYANQLNVSRFDKPSFSSNNRVPSFFPSTALQGYIPKSHQNSTGPLRSVQFNQSAGKEEKALSIPNSSLACIEGTNKTMSPYALEENCKDVLGIKLKTQDESELKGNSSNGIFVSKEAALTNPARLEVICLYPENGGWWVIRKEKSIQWNFIMDYFYKLDMETQPRFLAVKNCLCAAAYEGKWYRVQILETVPEIIVHFVDYGNTEICSPSDLKSLPSALKEIDGLAFFIKFTEDTNVKYSGEDYWEKTICIILEKVERGVKIVRVLESNETEKQPNIKNESSTSYFKNDYERFLKSDNDQHFFEEGNSAILKKPPPVNLPAPSSFIPVQNDRLRLRLICLYPENGGWWVILEENLGKWKSIMERFEQVNMNAQPKFLAAENYMCAAPYGGKWYRVRILKTVPKIIVHFVDYGNTETCTESDLRALPPGLGKIEEMAFFVKFLLNPGVKYCREDYWEKTFSVKLVREERGVKMVRVLDDKEPDHKNECNSSEIKNDLQVPNTKNSPKAELKGQQEEPIRLQLICLYPENGGWWVISHEKSTQWNIIMSKVEEVDMNAQPSFKAALNSICAAPFEGKWYRVRIVETMPEIRVHFIDYGNTETCAESDLKLLPPGLGEIEELTFFIKFSEGTDTKYSSEEYWEKTITVFVEKEESGAKIVKLVEDKIESGSSVEDKVLMCNGAQRPASSFAIKLEIPPVTSLASSSTVVIEYCIDAATVAVSNVDLAEAYGLLFNEVAICCLKGNALADLPPVGTIVGAPYEGVYYRAKVIKQVEGKLQLHFIDFGNEAAVDLAVVRDIPEEYRNYPPAATIVKLKGVANTNVGLLTLNSLATTRRELKLVYKNNLSEGVTLILDGKNINDEILSSKLELDDYPAIREKGVYSVRCLEDGLQNVTILCKTDEFETTGRLYCACLNDQLCLIIAEMESMVTQSCTESNVKAYRPSANEICAAFDDDWHRAICVEEINPHTVKVFFIDFGKTMILDTKYTRILSEELKNVPALANPCVIKGWNDSVSAEKKAEMMKLPVSTKIECTVRRMDQNLFELTDV